MTHRYFLSAIGTGVGKTLIASILVRKLKASYWKPVQAGSLENTDSHVVAQLASFDYSPTIHPETYRLNHFMSPHAGAKRDNIKINLEDFYLPKDEMPLIVEGAGGLLVPLSQELSVIDLIEHLHIPVILISQFYLGSINHTLLSVEALQRRNIPVKGIIFNGERNTDSEEIILSRSKLQKIGHIPQLQDVTPELIAGLGDQLNL